MSKTTLKAFIEKVEADSSLQNQLSEADADPVKIGKAAGFDFSYDDVKSVQDIFEKADTQLTQEELESVAGGRFQAAAANVDNTDQCTCFATHGPCTCDPPGGDKLKAGGGKLRAPNFSFWSRR